MKYSQIKTICNFSESLDSTPDWKEVLQNILNDSQDFEVDNVRFINSESIDSIQQDELSGDEYVLGCFNADFLAEVLDLPFDAIKAIQDAQAYSALGKMILSMNKLEELQQEYARLDGYGHHFNTWNGEEEEFRINGQMYYVFDNR